MCGVRDLRRTARRTGALAVLVAVAFGTTTVFAVPSFASGISISFGSRTLLGTMATPRYKPRTVRVSGSQVYVVRGVRWRGWNSAQAIGRGTTSIYGRRRRVTLIANSRAYCSTLGAYLYDRLQLRVG